MPRVALKGTYGYGRPRHMYGPGVVEVPEGLARALGLTALPEPAADEPTPEPEPKLAVKAGRKPAKPAKD